MGIRGRWSVFNGKYVRARQVVTRGALLVWVVHEQRGGGS
jgi:hypothetical protein